MPWKVYGNCVHALNDDGSKGESIKCHESSAKANAHVKALYANVPDATKELLIEAAEHDEIIRIKESATDGGYDIISVSTAAIADREGETFTVEAIDYDIAQAKETGDYPEYRVFHSPVLRFGEVTKMYRVGIFAIEEGKSYTDEFSIAVCKQLLSDHDGKWRTSRGFHPIEVSAECRGCLKPLGVTQKHMVVGFKCPHCESDHTTYKGMKNVQYKKAKTFDITATDVPAVAMTGMVATLNNTEVIMNKEQLKKRLLDAGLDADIIETRLKQVSEEQLKEYDEVPFAQVLKEFDDGGDDDAAFFLHPDAVSAIVDSVVVKMKELLEDVEISVDAPEFKEQDWYTELTGKIDAMEATLKELAQSDDQRLSDLVTPASRNRLRLFKNVGKKPMVEEDDEEDEEEYTTPNGTKVNKQTAQWLAGFQAPQPQGDAIPDASGNVYKSMTEFALGGKE